jgi:membrane protein
VALKSLNLLKRKAGYSYRRLKEQLRLSFNTLLVAYRRILQAEIPLIAGSLSFTTVLTLVPFLAVSLSVFHWLGGLEGLLKQIEPFILKNLVESSGAEFSRYLLKAIRRIHSGAIGVSGVIGLLLASTRLFLDMEKAIQRVWLVKKKRALWKRLIVYWSVMFFGPLVIAALLGVIGSKDLGLIRIFPSELVAAALALGGLFFIYKWVPARVVEFRPAFASALLATVGLALAQEFYAGTMRGLFRFSKVYGSLAGIPLFLLWIFLLWWIILLGATLTAILQERRDASAV